MAAHAHLIHDLYEGGKETDSGPMTNKQCYQMMRGLVRELGLYYGPNNFKVVARGVRNPYLIVRIKDGISPGVDRKAEAVWFATVAVGFR